MSAFPTPPQDTRLGFHYFPDTEHYRVSDLRTWLPELRAIGASWLTLVAPVSRAIPEYFIAGLLEGEIEPVLHFPFSLQSPPQVNDISMLFAAYARWGLHYVVLFDRPNCRAAWPSTAWAQKDLVERFLDLYLPLANTARQAGLVPVFPPLQPGGDYWDTAFLRATLQALIRRDQGELLDGLVLGAYAWAGERPLNWGSGGPERWPGARPYHTPEGEQDQRGFHVFDWYLAITQAVLGRPCPILLLKAGSRPGEHPHTTGGELEPSAHTLRNIAIAKAMVAGVQPKSLDPLDWSTVNPLAPVPAEVLACNFWLLAAEADSPHLANAWHKPDGIHQPDVSILRKWTAKRLFSRGDPATVSNNGHYARSGNGSTHAIAHYLLLPSYEWGIADWQLDSIRPFIKKHQPTIGFSSQEAARAARVTVLGGATDYPPGVLESLHAAGCEVDQLGRDGTSIATQVFNSI